MLHYYLGAYTQVVVLLGCVYMQAILLVGHIHMHVTLLIGRVPVDRLIYIEDFCLISVDVEGVR